HPRRRRGAVLGGSDRGAHGAARASKAAVQGGAAASSLAGDEIRAGVLGAQAPGLGSDWFKLEMIHIHASRAPYGTAMAGWAQRRISCCTPSSSSAFHCLPERSRMLIERSARSRLPATATNGIPALCASTILRARVSELASRLARTPESHRRWTKAL